MGHVGWALGHCLSFHSLLGDLSVRVHLPVVSVMFFTLGIG